MAVGIELTQSSLNNTLGNTALKFLRMLPEIEGAGKLMNRLSDPELAALNYTPAEILLLKAAVDALSGIKSGLANGDLAAIRELAGPGY